MHPLRLIGVYFAVLLIIFAMISTHAWHRAKIQEAYNRGFVDGVKHLEQVVMRALHPETNYVNPNSITQTSIWIVPSP